MTIFNQAIKRIFINKVRLLVLMIMPLLFIFMFAMQEERSLTIGFVDQDNSILSMKLLDSLAEMDKTKVVLIEENTVYDKAVSHEIDYAIIVEAGFEERIISGENAVIKEFYLNEKAKLFFARNYIDNFINSMKTLSSGVKHDQNKFFRALGAYEEGQLSLVNEASSEGKVQQTRQAMGFLVQFMLYMSVITAGIVLEDKNSGVFYRVFYAPITLKRYITENLLAFMIVGIIQVTLVLGLMKIFFGMDFSGRYLSIYTLLLLFSIVCISLGMWIVSLFKKPIGAYTTIVLATTPLVMLGGCYWPMDFMPKIYQNIALFIPTFWVMNGVDKILYHSKNILEITLELSVLIIFIGIFLGAGLFKKVDISG